MGRCAAEAMELARLCQEHNVALYTAYISRAYERTQAVRQLLLNREIVGDQITSVKYRLVGTGGARGLDENGTLPWRLDAEQSGGGLIMDVGCHVLDRIDYMCGPLRNVRGAVAENKSNRQPVEDYVHFEATIGECDWVTIPSAGAAVSCTWDFSGTTNEKKEDIDELIIAGSKGSLRMAGMSPAGPIDILDSKGDIVKTMDQFSMPEHTAQGLIQAVTNDLLMIQGTKKDEQQNTIGVASCLSQSDNAIRTQKVLDAVLSSYYGEREIGYWNRPQSWPGRKV